MLLDSRCELWDEAKKAFLDKMMKKRDQAGTLVNKADAAVRGPPSSHCTHPNCTLGYTKEVAIAEHSRR